MSAAVEPSPDQGNAKARLADAACQTENISMSAPLPLPMQYPANLVYAQSMLTICLGQLHHIDLCTMQLRMHLKERVLQSAAAAEATAPPVATAVAAANVVQLDPAVEAAAATAPEAAPAPAAQGTGAARQPEAEELERLQLLRRRLSAAVKVALVLMLLEVRYGWYFLYFFMVFLYIGGIFDPIIQRFQRQSAQMTLEQQLNAFRNERLRAEEVAAANAASAAAAASAAGASSSTAAAAELHPDAENTEATKSSVSAEPSDSTAEPKGQDGAGVGASIASGGLGDVGAGADSEDNRSGNGGAVPQGSDTAGGATADPAAGGGDDPNRPPWLHCFIYQLVVMFFGTLLPWWNPNPRYL